MNTPNTNPAPDMAVEARISELMSLAAEWKRLPGCTGASVDAQDALRDALRAALARPQEVAGVTEAEILEAFAEQDVFLMHHQPGEDDRIPECGEFNNVTVADVQNALKYIAASRAPVAVGVEPVTDDEVEAALECTPLRCDVPMVDMRDALEKFLARRVGGSK